MSHKSLYLAGIVHRRRAALKANEKPEIVSAYLDRRAFELSVELIPAEELVGIIENELIEVRAAKAALGF